MFSTVRYFIKTSIIFLVIGILSGLYLLIEKNYFDAWPHPDFVSAHTHIILVGSVMMMIMGVALWFFPRAEKDDKFYKPDVILFDYFLMTISTFTRFTFQVISSFSTSTGLIKLIITIASIAQVLGILIFFISMWGRIRSVGSHLREAKREKF